jgi:hypothetical protein
MSERSIYRMKKNLNIKKVNGVWKQVELDKQKN